MLNFFRSQSGSIKNDVLSGLTVALALVPEAIAFAFVAGVNPVIGLYSAFFHRIDFGDLWWASRYDLGSNGCNGSCCRGVGCTAWR